MASTAHRQSPASTSRPKEITIRRTAGCIMFVNSVPDRRRLTVRPLCAEVAVSVRCPSPRGARPLCISTSPAPESSVKPASSAS